MANDAVKEVKEESGRVEFTVSMDQSRVTQCELHAAQKGMTRTTFIRFVVYGWLDEQAKLATGK